MIRVSPYAELLNWGRKHAHLEAIEVIEVYASVGEIA